MLGLGTTLGAPFLRRLPQTPAIRFADATQVDHVILLSASILEHSFGDAAKQENFSRHMQQLGLPVPTLDATYANGADTSADYIAKLPNALAAAEGLSNVLFIVHGFGNDISASGPWPGGEDVFRDNMNQIVQAIHDAGHSLLLANVSYRIPPASNPAEPYNEHIVEPIIRQWTPQFWLGQKPAYDLYGLTYEYQQWHEGDGIHPGDRQQHLIRGYTASVIRRALTPVAPVTAAQLSGKRVLISFTLQNNEYYVNGVNRALMNSEASGPSGTTGASSSWLLRDTAGDELGGVRVFCAHSDTNTDGPTETDSGNDTSLSITNSDLLGQSAYINDATPGYTEIAGLPDGMTGTLTIASARYAEDDTRYAEVTVDGVTQVVDGAYRSDLVLATASWAFTVTDGKIVMHWNTQTGSSWAYLNGIQLDFD